MSTGLEIAATTVTGLNMLLTTMEASQRFRKIVATAIEENRDLSNSELAELRESAQNAIDEARND
jgi:hypothetical protein